MRKDIHPDYVEAKVVCSCGGTFTTRSTKSELHVELCNKCHPFYTGTQKFVDTGGRVQRFADKYGSAADSVMVKAAAEKEARQKAAQEAAEMARAARATKESRKADKGGRFETEQARRSGAADASGESGHEEEPAEAVAPEAVVEGEPPVEAETSPEPKDEAEGETSTEPEAEGGGEE